MEGFIDFIVSINKIALFAFIVVLGFLVYEVKKMIDERKKSGTHIYRPANSGFQIRNNLNKTHIFRPQ